MPFEVGETVGDYEIIDILKRSKTMVEYRVRNLAAGRCEVMRILPEELQADRERLERFYREIKIHASLEHPNILTFHDAFVLGTELVMTTELVEGVTLSDRLELGPLEWPEAASIAAQVLSALDLSGRDDPWYASTLDRLGVLRLR